MTNLPPCNVFIEACGSSNYWGRKFENLGHKVKLIHPKYVKPYVKRNKNDANDAAGIAAAARDPDMRFCNVKTENQQDMQSIHRIRSLLIQQRTALVNQIRGLLAEYGVIAAKDITNMRKMLVDVLGNNPNNMSALMLTCITELKTTLGEFDKKIDSCDSKIEELFAGNDACKRLEKIPGIGVLGATILASVLGNGSSFKNGRHFAAFLGLVPKQHSSGGKEVILGISKGGDTYIRTLLIQGAKSVLRWVDKKEVLKNDKLRAWLKNLKARKHGNIAAVALANKIARISWAVVSENTRYSSNYKFVNKMQKA
jgi:transposase